MQGKNTYSVHKIYSKKDILSQAFYVSISLNLEVSRLMKMCNPTD